MVNKLSFNPNNSIETTLLSDEYSQIPKYDFSKSVLIEPNSQNSFLKQFFTTLFWPFLFIGEQVKNLLIWLFCCSNEESIVLDNQKKTEENQFSINFYEYAGFEQKRIQPFDHTTFQVLSNSDKIKMAFELKEKGINPAIILDLNREGQSLFKRIPGSDHITKLEYQKLADLSAAIYCPVIFRPIDIKELIHLDSPSLFTFILSHSHPVLNPKKQTYIYDGKIHHLGINDLSIKLLYEKLRTQLHIALEKGHSHLILEPFGIEHGIPPVLLADIYKKLFTEEFHHCFKQISFICEDVIIMNIFKEVLNRS